MPDLLQKLRRPQEPLPPFPYEEQQVTFSAPGAELSGTLTLPRVEGKVPVVILVHGSGPQNRDEVIFGHKIFKLIADRITRAGIGVLRYDKRGVERSTGDFKSADMNVFASDVICAIEFLKTHACVDAEKIGLVGHSEGGTVSMSVAGRSPDVRFVVSLAGMAISGLETSMFQLRIALTERGLSADRIKQALDFSTRKFEILRSNPDNAIAGEKLRAFFAAEARKHQTLWHRLRWLMFWDRRRIQQEEQAQRTLVELEIATLLSPWVRMYLAYDPRASIEAVHCPVLALNGALDLQVPADENLKVFQDSAKVSGNKDLTTVKVPGVNHLFQTCQTGSFSEYARIEETVAPMVLEQLVNWLQSHTRQAE